MAEQLYTINETCDILKVTRKTIYTWINENKLQAVRVGSRYRISESAIEDFVTNGCKLGNGAHRLDFFCSYGERGDNNA